MPDVFLLQAIFCFTFGFCPELPCFLGKMFPFSHIFSAFTKGHHKHIMLLHVSSSVFKHCPLKALKRGNQLLTHPGCISRG